MKDEVLQKMTCNKNPHGKKIPAVENHNGYLEMAFLLHPLPSKFHLLTSTF